MVGFIVLCVFILSLFAILVCSCPLPNRLVKKNKLGEIHCDNGPAVEGTNGFREYYINGKRHREDGPAIEYPNGDRAWYKHGKRHREDGPAIEFADGMNTSWWLDGIEYTEAEYHRKLSTVKEVTMNDIEKKFGCKVIFK